MTNESLAAHAAVRTAREAVERAQRCHGGDALTEALVSVTNALNAAATMLARATDPRSAFVLHASWYVSDAAGVCWDAVQRQRHLDGGGRDPVRYAPALDIARRALSAAMSALDESAERVSA